MTNMKKLILLMVGLMSLTIYGQKIEIGAAVSNGGKYLGEINIIDSAQSFSKRGDWTITKGINPMFYTTPSYSNYYYYASENIVVPASNNYYLGTFVRLGKRTSNLFSTDFGFGIGAARIYEVVSKYEPSTSTYISTLVDNGVKPSIGMTFGINLQVMNRVSTHFKCGGLFNDNGGFAVVGFRYSLPSQK
jgi:hypothetical protein